MHSFYQGAAEGPMRMRLKEHLREKQQDQAQASQSEFCFYYIKSGSNFGVFVLPINNQN